MISNTHILATRKGEYESEGKYTKPASFTLQLYFSVRKMQGWGSVYLPSHLYPPILVRVIFWHVIPTSVFIYLFSYNYYVYLSMYTCNF